jgi:hypothetical protein
MSDLQLLELAAKAAGLKWHDNRIWVDEIAEYIPWNPLADDGDALRLAVKLRLSIENGEYDVSVEVWFELNNLRRVNEFYGEDACAATRRAIVRAAAEIGKEMK